jgi:type VII secretion protein EccE
VARPAPALLPDADTRTRPLLLRPPVRPPWQAPPEPVTQAIPVRRPWSRPVREYVEHLGPLQVLCWQVAALAVLLTVRQPWPVLVSASVAAAALLALTGVRVGGRWLYEVTALAAGFLGRPRRRDLPENGSTPAMAVALLTELLPGAGIRTVETGHGAAMAISHRNGLTALLRPRATGRELLRALPMPSALLPVSEDHEFGVQEVFHVAARPDRPSRVWFGVHATRTVETATDDELVLVLRNAARRIRRALARAGVETEPLAEEQALAAVAGLAHVTGGRHEVREDWRFWRTGAVSQAAYVLAGWDRLADTDARRLTGVLLAGLPGVATTVALSARTDRRGEPRVGAVLRLAATTEAAVTAAATTITDRLAPSGVRPARLDGTHLSGVAASLPIGVFLP